MFVLTDLCSRILLSKTTGHELMDHGIQTGEFESNYRKAIANSQLQRALKLATGRFTLHRAQAVAEVGEEWEALRNQARVIKEHAIANLDRYLEEFATNVEGLGGRVFWASDAAEANEYITRLAIERGVKLAVKSKSMMTEEVELNSALSAAGVEPVETDLGEYIVQLAGERPSHIIAPAIHKTRAEIADLFTDKLHVERTEEIERMTAMARKVLRDRFAAAGMGVTGANFGVAETGTIVLVENEGNIRLTTSLPKVHVALMGIEKVIPSIQDLAVLLRVLPRSASGQRMSSYVSFISGVKSTALDEGPEELHVVILDNGRSAILANPKLRESLYCIRCGACLNVCPVYQKIGGHAYGWIYPGPIGSVITPQLVGLERAGKLPFASSLCGACREVCPIKINIPDMLLELRHEVKEGQGLVHLQGIGDAATRTQSAQNGGTQKSPWRKLAASITSLAERTAFRIWALAMSNAARYNRAARFGRLVSDALGDSERGLPLPAWTRTRNLPQLAPQSFRELWPELAGKISHSADSSVSN
jgi:L-lactate dehydrogenase complex protein LldF